jgi:nicotinate-nucleotide adenylyltransferase
MTEEERLFLADALRLPLSAPGMRIGLLGGSFNPPHAAHRLISVTALKRLRLAQVWWVVTPGNPLKDHADLASLPQRLLLSKAVTAHSHIKITGFEAQLNTSYTAQTLSFLRQHFPAVRFVWLMGADNLATVHKWKDWRSIFELMPVAVVDRPFWRYRALSSPTANSFARFRVPEEQAAALPDMTPPAWCYLSGPLSNLSSTALRGGKPQWPIA